MSTVSIEEYVTGRLKSANSDLIFCVIFFSQRKPRIYITGQRNVLLELFILLISFYRNGNLKRKITISRHWRQFLKNLENNLIKFPWKKTVFNYLNFCQLCHRHCSMFMKYCNLFTTKCELFERIASAVNHFWGGVSIWCCFLSSSNVEVILCFDFSLVFSTMKIIQLKLLILKCFVFADFNVILAFEFLLLFCSSS